MNIGQGILVPGALCCSHWLLLLFLLFLTLLLLPILLDDWMLVGGLCRALVASRIYVFDNRNVWNDVGRRMRWDCNYVSTIARAVRVCGSITRINFWNQSKERVNEIEQNNKERKEKKACATELIDRANGTTLLYLLSLFKDSFNFRTAWKDTTTNFSVSNTCSFSLAVVVVFEYSFFVTCCCSLCSFHATSLRLPQITTIYIYYICTQQMQYNELL